MRGKGYRTLPHRTPSPGEPWIEDSTEVQQDWLTAVGIGAPPSPTLTASLLRCSVCCLSSPLPFSPGANASSVDAASPRERAREAEQLSGSFYWVVEARTREVQVMASRERSREGMEWTGGEGEACCVVAGCSFGQPIAGPWGQQIDGHTAQ